jgi:hypothetical protein
MVSGDPFPNDLAIRCDLVDRVVELLRQCKARDLIAQYRQDQCVAVGGPIVMLLCRAPRRGRSPRTRLYKNRVRNGLSAGGDWIRTSSTRARSIPLMPPKARDGSARPLSFRTARRPASKRRGPDRRGRSPRRRRTAPNFAWSGKKTATLYGVTAPADPRPGARQPLVRGVPGFCGT